MVNEFVYRIDKPHTHLTQQKEKEKDSTRQGWMDVAAYTKYDFPSNCWYDTLYQ